MRKKIVVRGPALSLSGYGEQTRFALRSLRAYEDFFDIYLVCVGWGQCGWLSTDDEERQWIDTLAHKTFAYTQQGGKFDMSLQVTIPNEWEKLAPVNVGYTAGIEVDKISPKWIEKAAIMDRVIVVSNHAKSGFDNTVYTGQDKRTGQMVQIKNSVPVEVVNYPVKVYDQAKMDLDFETDFNFLVVAQWSPRKNVENTIKWFIEEFVDQEVGLVLKISTRNNSIMDKQHTEKRVANLLKDYPERKCKVYLLHGDLSNEEMTTVYNHPKIKALVSLTHGEGYGLPLFEAAYNGLPIVCCNWSGQCDFINVPVKDKKKNKIKNKALVAKVDYELKPIQKKAVWPGVLENGTQWCFAKQGSYKMKLREVYKNIGRYQNQAKNLQKWVLEEFEESKMYRKFAEATVGEPLKQIAKEDLPKVSILTSVFNAKKHLESFFEDITRQTIFDQCDLVLVNPKESPTHEEEQKIIAKWMEKYPLNIKNLVPGDPDDGVYSAWNFALQHADGEYITNANVDDRKAPHSLERHAKELYLNKDVSLVYADSYITKEDNETFEKNSSNGRKYNFEQFSKEAMLRGNQCHNNPMWRKSLHEKHGVFDCENYKSAGDWEFFLRLTFGGEKFQKINEVLGLYQFNPKGISTNPENFEWKQKEERKIFLTYQTKYQEEKAEMTKVPEQPKDIVL